MTDRPEMWHLSKQPTQLNLKKKVGLDKTLALEEVKIASRKECNSGKGSQGKAGKAKQSSGIFSSTMALIQSPDRVMAVLP